MNKFQKGDRVIRVAVTSDRNTEIGDTGIVLTSNRYHTGVRWDEKPPRGGHDCGGLCETGYGWNVPTSDLDFFNSDPIDDGEYDTVDICCMIGMFGSGSE